MFERQESLNCKELGLPAFLSRHLNQREELSQKFVTDFKTVSCLSGGETLRTDSMRY